MSIQTITIKDKDYPELLKKIYNPPQKLYIFGELKKQEKYPLAIVGTRKISNYGKQIARLFAEALAKTGITIVSGLALGVDGLAHQIALEKGARTIAVLGSGLNVIYPPVHKKLAQDIIASGGAVISEYSPDTSPTKKTFPTRNRIISGLSLGVLVIEAPRKSGALITARTAIEQGKEIFVIPGRINDFNSEGCNYLIKMGARLVTNPEEIIETIIEVPKS
ncbi:DNA protecting protein DprA [Candidatus Parcubacteria bacterium 4484_255]|nr:MAG: DNA protecting protein DprA [Candidatus Parcubacteria bacterium 4484_255]